MSSGYFSLTMAAARTGHNAYCTISPAPELQISQGGFTFQPTGANTTTVVIYPQVAQLQMPPCEAISGSLLIVTHSPVVAGQLLVSPPLEVSVTLTLYGNGGVQIGQSTLDAGQSTLNFKWDVSSATPIPESDAHDAIARYLPKQQQ
ncbi:MAG: hypothetical protein JO197_18825 [Acidobacteria bacterium]|nr:hypothetical protein [Acidobacteriota bacterium]MBV9477139.1 hypothetical protein [Acidobacteriota bacterium]